MIDTRVVSPAEVEDRRLFPGSYTTKNYLSVATSGNEAEPAWKLTLAKVGRPMRRRLEGETLDGLVQLYGPLDRLQLIGAFDGDELVGLLTWKYEDWNRMVWLCDVRVREDHRRKGIAGKMLEDLQWAAMRTDGRGIMLETQTSNYPAIQFYLSKRFQMTGLNTRLYGKFPNEPPESALFFFRALE